MANHSSASKIFVAAGEASGERYGAMLIESLRARLPQAHFFGLGGVQMEAAGCERIVRAEEIAVMGITEVVRHLPAIYGKYRALVRSIRERKPDLAVLIDFPDVNFRLAEHLRKLDVPVVYFVSPQLWAWKQHRIRWVRERVTKMLVIFPFEEAYYRERGVDATFVGHPLADVPPPAVTRAAFAHLHGLDAAKPWIGLLPGSRNKELRLNLSEMLRAAALLGPQYEYVLPAAATLDAAWVRQQVQSACTKIGAPVAVTVVPDARATLHHARASIVASGTATVEAALAGNPFVVVYRLSALSYAVAERMVHVPHVAMANLIAGVRVVPELIQSEFTAENLAQNLQPLLRDGAERSAMLHALAGVRTALQMPTSPAMDAAPTTAIDRAAEQVLRTLAEADARSQ
jgi:lipid-A-disaccharide synthase